MQSLYFSALVFDRFTMKHLILITDFNIVTCSYTLEIVDSPLALSTAHVGCLSVRLLACQHGTQ